MNLPKITYKQREIIKLLYRFRFLNRIQIQAFMHHKDYKTINQWLKDLREKHYVEWIYSTDFAERTKPAIYYLGLNAIRYFRQRDLYSIDELRKRYREPSRSQTYIDRCLLIADCCLDLENQRTNSVHYFYETETEFLVESYFNFITDSDLVHPHLCVSKEKYDDYSSEDVSVASYLLEIFDPTIPRYRIKKRLGNYVKFLDEEEWDPEADNHTLPIIRLVCPRTADLIYAKRRTRGLLADVYDEDRKTMHIQFTTAPQLKEHGFTGNIWEEA